MLYGDTTYISVGEPIMAKLMQHHVKYKEIHGYDEIVIMGYSEHRKLHNKLRREGRCKSPVELLHKVTKTAYARSPKGMQLRRAYKKEHRKTIRFWTALAPHVVLVEHLEIYNEGNVVVSSYFVGNHGKKLLVVDVKS